MNNLNHEICIKKKRNVEKISNSLNQLMFGFRKCFGKFKKKIERKK